MYMSKKSLSYFNLTKLPHYYIFVGDITVV